MWPHYVRQFSFFRKKRNLKKSKSFLVWFQRISAFIFESVRFHVWNLQFFPSFWAKHERIAKKTNSLYSSDTEMWFSFYSLLNSVPMNRVCHEVGSHADEYTYVFMCAEHVYVLCASISCNILCMVSICLCLPNCIHTRRYTHDMSWTDWQH